MKNKQELESELLKINDELNDLKCEWLGIISEMNSKRDGIILRQRDVYAQLAKIAPNHPAFSR